MKVNGAPVSPVFIDTGAQYTLITREAADAAGVRFGASNVRLVGFAGLDARPGLIESLEIGDLTLHDVPVLVGDPAPLMAAEGRMALGTELMHHVRFTIDYRRSAVYAQPARDARAAEQGERAWKIPLWTFSSACLAQGRLSRGPLVRVLVDTGDRAGTFVSPRWGRRALPQFQRPHSRMVFEFKPRGIALDTMELGTGVLRNWPVLETIPRELERLDLVDILLGRDLLGAYQLTIDMQRRVLELRGPDDGPASLDAQNLSANSAHDEN